MRRGRATRSLWRWRFVARRQHQRLRERPLDEIAHFAKLRKNRLALQPSRIRQPLRRRVDLRYRLWVYVPLQSPLAGAAAHGDHSCVSVMVDVTGPNQALPTVKLNGRPSFLDPFGPALRLESVGQSIYRLERGLGFGLSLGDASAGDYAFKLSNRVIAP